MSRFGQLYFSLNGRLSRRDFWLLWMLPGSIIVGAVGLLFSPFDPMSPIALALIVILLWPSVAVSVKRWHDIDVSGWWVLVNFIPYVGWLIVLVFNGFSRGTIGKNRFGADPIRAFPTSNSEAL